MRISEVISEEIGPHNSKELELMLAGKKIVALLTPLDIPPFQQYLDNGQLKLVATPRGFGGTKVYVVTVPGAEKRGEKLARVFSELVHKNTVSPGFTHSYEGARYHAKIGLLLGYDPIDIAHFLARHSRARLSENIDEDISRRGALGGLLGIGALGGLGAGGVAGYNAYKDAKTNTATQPNYDREAEKLQRQSAQRKAELAREPQPFYPAKYDPSAHGDMQENLKNNLLVQVAHKYGIKNPSDMANFLSQCQIETIGWKTPVENMNYNTPERIRKVFSSKFPTSDSAAPYVNNPVALANYVYAGKNGNGDEASGDGWRYRGRGFKQLTGRGNYAAAGQWRDPSNPSIYLEKPWLLSSDPYEAALASVWFFMKNVGLGKSSEQATRAVNPAGLKKLERRAAMAKIQRQLQKQKQGKK